MSLDPTACYRALASRDRRFEGRFVVAVRTTGVYCRPGCPAPLPKRRNTSFYPCAAAAEDAGYRPCRRCRPEAAPGTPVWHGTSATVSRALRLIGEGGLDGSPVDALAERLGVGARHLRRLFVRHLGAAPLAVARSRRTHFARRLIDETSLPLTDVALGSGFQSVRAFNSAMRATFHAAPRDLRRERGRAPGEATLRLRLPHREPYDWDGLVGFLGARAVPGVERVDTNGYARTFAREGGGGVLRVARARDARALELTLPHDVGSRLMGLVEAVGRVFDVHADPLAIADALGRDRRLVALLRRAPGLRVPGAFDRFELVVRAVLGQQVSVAAARTFAGRIAARFGAALADAARQPGLEALFPGPERLADAPLEEVGLTRSRATCIRELARRVADGRLRLDADRGLDAWTREFTSVPGIGDWTAQYVAMRALGEPDAFPAGDLGVRRALARGGPLPSVRETRRQAEAWRPWRAYATLALWRAPSRPRRKE